MHPKQSWASAVVDISIVASVVALCFVPTVSPMAWSVLGQIALVRFGVAVTKQAFGGGGGSGNGTGSSGPSSDRDPPRKRDVPSIPPEARRQILRFAWPAVFVFIVYVAWYFHIPLALAAR